MSAGGRSITLLGRVAIGPSGDGPEATLRRGRRAELVFAYLAAEHHRMVTHDELADALWPEGLPESWEAGLRGVLTDVRRFLIDGGLDPGEVLTTARRGHRLLLPSNMTVDLDEARNAMAEARVHLADGAAPAAAERAARASSLARLPFLPNHEGEWVDRIRREMETINARALELEARAQADAGDLAAATTAAERLVSAEPFNEAAHQLRIRILGQSGDRSGAIKAYEHCRAVLADELGVEPSDETVAAYRAATQHDESVTARPAAAQDGLGDLRMLVVEDHDFQRRTALMLLRKLGVGAVADAADGVAALELLHGGTVADVILCDIDMPGMDGVEFIRHVAERELASAVIIASALDTKVVHAVRALSEGYGLQVLGAVEKPLTARRLGELLASYRPRPRSGSPAETPSMGGVSISGFDVETAMREGRLTVHFQPAVDVETGRVAAAVARPRWHEPGKGWIPPSLFMPVLEREGLLAAFSERALETACAHLRDYAVDGFAVAITVTVAPESLRDPALADRAAAIALAAGAGPTRVTFALDERALRTAPSSALGVLTRLRVKSFGVSLANFGSGQASAEQLRRVPLTEVTLAPVLVTAAAGDVQRVRALEETIEVARLLDVTIVGDGCESDDDLRLLLELGCDRVQGSLIADTVPGDELPAWAASWDPDRLGVGGRE